MVMHPAVAAIVAIIFNADLFYQFDLWTKAAIRSGNSSFALRMIERVAGRGILHLIQLVRKAAIRREKFRSPEPIGFLALTFHQPMNAG